MANSDNSWVEVTPTVKTAAATSSSSFSERISGLFGMGASVPQEEEMVEIKKTEAAAAVSADEKLAENEDDGGATGLIVGKENEKKKGADDKSVKEKEKDEEEEEEEEKDEEEKEKEEQQKASSTEGTEGTEVLDVVEGLELEEDVKSLLLAVDAKLDDSACWRASPCVVASQEIPNVKESSTQGQQQENGPNNVEISPNEPALAEPFQPEGKDVDEAKNEEPIIINQSRKKEGNEDISRNTKELPANSPCHLDKSMMGFPLTPMATPTTRPSAGFPQSQASLGVDFISAFLTSSKDEFAAWTAYVSSSKLWKKSFLGALLAALILVTVVSSGSFIARPRTLNTRRTQECVNSPTDMSALQSELRVATEHNAQLQVIADSQAKEIARLKLEINAYKAIEQSRTKPPRGSSKDKVHKYKEAFERLKQKMDVEVRKLRENLHAAKISKERQDQYAGKARKYKEALDSLKARTDNQIKDLQEELRRHQEDLASGKLKYENEKRRVEMFQRALKNKIKDFEGQKKRFKNTSSFEGLEKYAKQLKSLYAETFQWAKQYATL